MPAPQIRVDTVRLAAGQCLMIHLPEGAAVHVQAGRVAVGRHRWLAEQPVMAWQRPQGEGLEVIDQAGWHRIVADSPAQLRILWPAPRPSLWRLIKSRLGRSGLLPGYARPPDDKAAEPSVPHATSQ
ncbi:hypothetical protein [Cupriavidus agavae]|uniref:DUF2917 domain-containing protein n=1 Tax=Cupriavidus agavae TaxID=1001822 RepID=A0A4Q7S8G4_9BURK|nr:hypothetical protein [Cupriavidus agavae]RZT42751.1 hypothetical protein EV147_1792 [Cupriavidus agavae]